VGLVGLVLIIEATRRSIGWAVPLLGLAFVLHARYAPALPAWALSHGGHSLEHIVEMTYVQSLGVFGAAASVMFRYVFLFVVFGAFLESTGATQFIVDFAKGLFGRSPGGPAK